jgi:hypothetical protein
MHDSGRFDTCRCLYGSVFPQGNQTIAPSKPDALNVRDGEVAEGNIDGLFGAIGPEDTRR